MICAAKGYKCIICAHPAALQCVCARMTLVGVFQSLDLGRHGRGACGGNPLDPCSSFSGNPNLPRAARAVALPLSRHVLKCARAPGVPQMPSMTERYLICRKFGAAMHLVNPTTGVAGMLKYVAQQCEANQSYWTPLQVMSLPADGCPRNQCPCNQYPCNQCPCNQCRWPRCIGLLKSLPLAYSCCVRAKFANPDNAKTHMLTTGPEIWEQTAGAVDYFVAGAGTAGTVAAANGRPGGGSTLLQPPLAHFGGCCYGKFVSRLTAHTACPQPTGGWGWGVPEGD